MFHERLEQEVKKAHRNGTSLALMFIDLDHFKDINDTLGHDSGDLLLKEAAQRLKGCVRETDTVARLGGDEFTVILGQISASENVERVGRDILQKLSEPFQLAEEVVFISGSIGVTLYPEDATEIEELLRNADQAMYAAKQQGRNRYHYFTASMQEHAQTKMRLVNDMRAAIAENQFRLMYQPIVELATGAIHKAEALIRWQHPVRGLVSPDEFIRTAEDTGMIMIIGDWVFRTATEQAARWRMLHDPQLRVSVNISPVQFRNEGINLPVWFDHLRKIGLAAEGIVFEITEGLLMDASANVTDQLLELHNAGIQVALDDFGTGYSSLSYIKKFDIDYLKIAPSFVRNLTNDPDDLVLCEAIIVMAHKLGMKVIAEGVETKAQLDILAAAGCDYSQGHYFSNPLSEDEFGNLLKKARLAAEMALPADSARVEEQG
jgi:diguanylate cyclase (GGDEF)-like protein